MMATFHIDEPREIGKKKDRLSSREKNMVKLISNEAVNEARGTCSENYYKLFREAKTLKESVFLNEFDEYLLSTDIGELAMHEGVEVPLDHPLIEAEYQGRKVKLGKPMQGDAKKFKVYVKNPKGNVVKVNFGQGGDAKVEHEN